MSTREERISGSRVVAPRKEYFFYYNIYFIICQVYIAGGRDESNIFFNEKDDDYGVIVRIWMGPVAPTPANLLTNTRQFVTLTNSPIYQFANFATIIYKSCKKYCNSPSAGPWKPRRGIKFLHKLLAILQKLSAKFAKLQLLLQL